MKSFEYIADIWLKSELFGKQYSYRKGLEKDVEHLVSFFGNSKSKHRKTLFKATNEGSFISWLKYL